MDEACKIHRLKRIEIFIEKHERKRPLVKPRLKLEK